METKLKESSSCDLCCVELESIQAQLEHDFSLIHHMKLDNKYKNMNHKCSLCDLHLGNIKDFVCHVHGTRHQKEIKARKKKWEINKPTLDLLKKRYHVEQYDKIKPVLNNKQMKDNMEKDKLSTWDSPNGSNLRPDQNYNNRNNRYNNVHQNLPPPSRQNRPLQHKSFQYHSQFNTHFKRFESSTNNFSWQGNRFSTPHFGKFSFRNNFQHCFTNYNKQSPWQPYNAGYRNWDLNQENNDWNNSPRNTSPQWQPQQQTNYTSNFSSIATDNSSANLADNSNCRMENASSKDRSKSREDKSKTGRCNSSSKEQIELQLIPENNDDSMTSSTETLLNEAVPPRAETSSRDKPKIPLSTRKAEQIGISEVKVELKTLKLPPVKPGEIINDSMSNGKHTYFLSSDSDSNELPNIILPDCSDSSDDEKRQSHVAEKNKEESFNKDLLNRLVNFPCTRKQQMQLAKWVQEHSKLKKKLMFPRFNMQLVPPNAEKTEDDVELRKVLSEMMTDLPVDTIEALVKVLKGDDKEILQQQDLINLLIPNMEGEVVVQESETVDTESVNSAVPVPQCPEISSPNEPTVSQIFIKPEPKENFFQMTDHDGESVQHPSDLNLSSPLHASVPMHLLPGNRGENVSSADLQDHLHGQSSFIDIGCGLSSKQTNFHPIRNDPNLENQFSEKLVQLGKGIGSPLQEPTRSSMHPRVNESMNTRFTKYSQGTAPVASTSTFNVPFVDGNLTPGRPDDNDLHEPSRTRDDRFSSESNIEIDRNTASAEPQPTLQAQPNRTQEPADSNHTSASPVHPSQSPGVSVNNCQKNWTEMPEWFKMPSPVPSRSSAQGQQKQSTTADDANIAPHDLVEKLLSLSKQEEELRGQSQKVEQVITEMSKILEEWKHKRSQLQQQEVQLRNTRLNLLQTLQDSLTKEPAGECAVFSASNSSGPNSNDTTPRATTTTGDDQQQNYTYLGTLDSTLELIQQCGVNLFPKEVNEPDMTTKKRKTGMAGATKKNSPKVPKTLKGKGVKGKKRNLSDSCGDKGLPDKCKEPKRKKRKQNNSAKESIMLQDLLNQFTKSSVTTSIEKKSNVSTQAHPAKLQVKENVEEQPLISTFFGPLEAHGGAVLDIKLTNDYVYTCSVDHTAKKFEIQNPKNVVVYGDHEDTVTSLQLITSEGGQNQVFTASHDGFLRCFDSETGNMLHKISAGSPIMCMAKGWGKLYLGLSTGDVVPYKINSKKFLDVFEFSEKSVNKIAIGSEGLQRLLCVVTFDGRVAIRNAASGLLIRFIDRMVRTPCCLKVEGELLFLTTTDHNICIYDLSSGKMLKMMDCRSSATGLYILEDYIYLCCFDGIIRCYLRKNWSLHRVYYAAGRSSAMCMDISNGWVFSGNRHGTLEAFKLDYQHSYICNFQSCGYPFGFRRDLQHHLKAYHLCKIQSSTAMLWSKCPWNGCRKALVGNSGVDKLEVLEDHIMDHVHFNNHELD